MFDSLMVHFDQLEAVFDKEEESIVVVDSLDKSMEDGKVTIEVPTTLAEPERREKDGDSNNPGSSYFRKLENTASVSTDQSCRGIDTNGVSTDLDITKNCLGNQDVDFQQELIRFLNVRFIVGDEDENMYRFDAIISKAMFQNSKAGEVVKIEKTSNDEKKMTFKIETCMCFVEKMMNEGAIPWNPPWTMGNGSISVQLYTSFLHDTIDIVLDGISESE
uniref:Uncharacterized protein n=1 Tax=Nelumbo nucifera TaxID=4432 RepID=A0A822XZH1_NELNU|nr:TPA_asm: hypothetical protein HUJ06_025668 [Nelumbo nucifera]